MKTMSQNLAAGAIAVTALPVALAAANLTSGTTSRRISRKQLIAAGTAAATGLIGAPAAFGRTPRRRRKRRTAEQKAAQLRAARERICIEHAHSENVHQFDETLETFDHARYELVPLGEIYDGHDAVEQYYTDSRTTFPDQRNSDMVLRHADEAVIVEFHLSGTMKGFLRGIPPTGKSFKIRVTAFFLFEPGSTKIHNERAYFDLYSLLDQIGLLEAIALGQFTFPANGGIPINPNEPGVKPVET